MLLPLGVGAKAVPILPPVCFLPAKWLHNSAHELDESILPCGGGGDVGFGACHRKRKATNK